MKDKNLPPDNNSTSLEDLTDQANQIIESLENEKDLISNKKITITDGRQLDRDGGSHQWRGHDVNSGIDFDIWDPKKGVGEGSHILFKQPVVMDAFCSVVRVIDDNKVFIWTF